MLDNLLSTSIQDAEIMEGEGAYYLLILLYLKLLYMSVVFVGYFTLYGEKCYENTYNRHKVLLKHFYFIFHNFKKAVY